MRTQSNNFDKEFLPDEVAQEFAESFSETNAEYATSTFAEAFNTQWNMLNNIYGKNKSKPALILIDEAPKLKENAVQMARAVEISHGNSTAFFSATPDKFLSKEFKIKQQILLSPKERTALGVGKLANIFVAKGEVYDSSTYHAIMQLYKKRAHGPYVNMEEQYIRKYENTHVTLSNFKKGVQSFNKK